ncbi:MAG: hypothetical protein ACYC54_03370 [Sedimentisphaerales bacterium]
MIKYHDENRRPVIALLTRILCRELVLQNEYLRTENRILKSKVSKRLSFTDDERRTLVDAAMALGKKLMHDIVSIVRPETLGLCTYPGRT